MEKKNNNNKKIKDSFKVSEVISIIFITLVIGIIVGYAVTINFNSDKLNNNDEALEEFVDTYNDIKENYFYLPPEVWKKDMKDAMPSVKTLTELVRRFAGLLDEKKRQRGMIDFNDMEQFALAILTEERDGELEP